jgi:RHS repeat-associated protein
MLLTALSTVAPGDEYNGYKYNGKELQDKMNLGWLDYGKRPYTPDAPRWLTPDPLAEWNYSWSPYIYANNNPITNIDPDGQFSTKFGAWLYKLFHGGEIQIDSKGLYFVRDGYDEGSSGGAGVEVSYSWGKKQSNTNSPVGTNNNVSKTHIYTQNFGWYLYMPGGGISPPTNTSKSYEMMNVEDLLPLIRGAGAGKLNTGPLNPAKGLNKTNSAIKEIQGAIKENADKKAKESTGDETDISGRPVESDSTYLTYREDYKYVQWGNTIYGSRTYTGTFSNKDTAKLNKGNKKIIKKYWSK